CSLLSALRWRSSPLLTPVCGSGREDRFADFFRWKPGSHLELASIFQQLRQPLMHKLRRIIAKQFSDFFIQIAARSAVASPEELEKAFRHFKPLRVGRVDADRDNPVASETDSN